MVSLLLLLNNNNITIIILSPKRNCTMSFKQRPEDSGIEGKKYRDSVAEHWPDSCKKNKSSAHLPQQPWWHGGFLGTNREPSTCDKLLTAFWWLRQKVKQEAPSSRSSRPRGAILDRDRPWGGTGRPSECKHRKQKVNGKLGPDSPSTEIPTMALLQWMSDTRT